MSKEKCDTACKWYGDNGCVLTGECRHEIPIKATPAASHQIGGQHYVGMAIQPFEYIHRNDIGFAEGCVIKYVSRWRSKNGIEDLKKARHFLDLLIEAETTTASR